MMNLLSSSIFVLSLTDIENDENDGKHKVEGEKDKHPSTDKPDKNENKELRNEKKNEKQQKTRRSESESSDSEADTGDNPINTVSYIGTIYRKMYYIWNMIILPF